MVTGLILIQQHGIPFLFSCGYDHAPKKVEWASTFGCGLTVSRPGCGHRGSPRWKENLSWMDVVQPNGSMTSVWQTFHGIARASTDVYSFPASADLFSHHHLHYLWGCLTKFSWFICSKLPFLMSPLLWFMGFPRCCFQSVRKQLQQTNFIVPFLVP